MCFQFLITLFSSAFIIINNSAIFSRIFRLIILLYLYHFFSISLIST
nr:MAG TPA: hypothetical protein [Caudoviricetes sp.]